MANCSNAYGHIEIKMEGARKLAELMNKALKPYAYNTDIDLDSPEDDEPNYFCSRFWGCGRWAYEANCRNFWEWLKNGVKEHHLEKEFEKIKNKDFEIVLEFNDEEGGFEVLYEMTYLIHHTAGKDEVRGEVAEEKNYDYTPENLAELGIYDNINDAKEACGIYE